MKCGFCKKKITKEMEDIEYSRYIGEVFCCPDHATSRYYDYLESIPVGYEEALEQMKYVAK